MPTSPPYSGWYVPIPFHVTCFWPFFPASSAARKGSVSRQSLSFQSFVLPLTLSPYGSGGAELVVTSLVLFPSLLNLFSRPDHRILLSALFSSCSFAEFRKVFQPIALFDLSSRALPSMQPFAAPTPPFSLLAGQFL